MVFNNNLLLGAAGAAGGYTIDQSIRFNKDDDAKLTRTFGTATNRKIYTLSVWEKNGNSAGSLLEYNATPGVTWANITFGQDGRVDFFDYSGGSARIDLRTSAIYRDPSAWYHVVVAVDTTQATSTDRIKMYVNGVQITSFGTATYPSQNFEGFLNSSVLHLIGDGVNGPFDGYLGEYHFIDGQALDPTSFGEYNANGVWVPIEASPTYGTNGFYITGATASDLGEDFSGNNNDFTSSGLTTADQMLDTPTANLPTFNLLSSGAGTLSDGNLQYVGTGSWTNTRLNLLLPETGKWAVRFKTTTSYQQIMVGACAPDSATTYGDLDANGVAMIRYNTLDGNFVTRVGGSRIEDTGPPTVAAQTWFQLLFDMDTGQMGVAADGATSGTFADISTYPIMDLHGASLSTARQIFALVYSGIDSGAGAILDAGQSGWEPAVTGFSALTLANLPNPTIADPTAYMQTTVYTGNGTAIGSGGLEVNQSENSTFQPDFVWIKNRTTAGNEHDLYDALRGATKVIFSSTTGAEATVSEGLASFDADGFTVGNRGEVNTSGNSMVAWQWKANGAGSSNTDGTVTSTVSADATSGFSIAKWTHTTASNYTVGHGLGAVPKMILVKTTDQGTNWGVYHSDITVGNRLILNSTSAQVAGYWGANSWTSSTFSIGSARDVNGSTMIGYSFAEVEGFSSFSSYTGNGSTDGPFVYTGFKPAFVMTKRTNSAGDWKMWDNQRGPYNVNGLTLAANSSGAESSGVAQHIDFLSNGFKIRGNDTETNGSGSTYVYMAFAETPFKTATAR